MVFRTRWCVLLLSAGCAAAPTAPTPSARESTPPTPSKPDRVVFSSVRESIGPGVIRYDFDAAARAAALPSYAFVDPVPAPTKDPLPATTPDWVLSQQADGRYRVDLRLAPGTSVYGLGEAGGALERHGVRTILWNTDAYGYRADTQSLYQSHPWLFGVRKDGSSFGLLVDSTYRMTVTVDDVGAHFVIQGPAPRLVWFEGVNPEEVLIKLARFTGTMPMPPKWALGFHQSRYSYFPEKKVRSLAAEFRKRKLPCDVIWFDIDYMDEFRVFTFNKNHFPDPKRLNDDLLKDGFHNVWMINPGVAAEPEKFPPGGYSVYDELMAQGFAVRKADGQTPIRHRVWPGLTVLPDFTRPDVREWWAGLYAPFVAQNITGVWNDMNEPAVFDHASKTLPKDARHIGEPALGGPGTHARFHNVYGMLMVRATRDGIARARPDHRPFVLTRANFIGGHRYAATWTGDNSSDWWDLEMSVAMILNLGLSGQPFAGPDIGGFIGAVKPELFARWMGIGTLLPFARAHTAKNNPAKEPWAFGEAVEQTSRRALENRYVLLPYLYTVFEEANRVGLPVVRPVFFADPIDRRLRTEDDAFLIGSSLLVVPHLDPDNKRAPALPKGAWRSVTLRGAGDPALPTFRVAPGAIVPTGPVMQYVGERPVDPLTLIINPKADGTAEGLLYEDAGDGYGHLRGDYRHTRFWARYAKGRLELTRSPARLRTPNGRAEWPGRGLRTREIRVRVLTDVGELEGRASSKRRRAVIELSPANN